MKAKIVSRTDEITTLLEIINNREEYKENSKNGLVILLNGEWGTGKTTFLEQLVEVIKKEESINLFNIYNAYNNDYYENAYIPFFASIEDKIKLEQEFSNFIKTTGKITTNSLVVVSYAVTKSIFKKKFDIDLDDIKNNMMDIQSEQENSYLKNYKEFDKYKKQIKKKIEELCSNKPMIFIVDELDRCKPSFAMETLEIIKHFFDIKNCIFIVSVDKVQLSASAKSIYGEGISSEKYFSKLFDYQFNLLPINFYETIDSTDKANIDLIEWTTKIYNILNISLRDSKKIFNELIQKNKNWTIEQSLFILFLLILKYTDLSFYKTIINNNYRKYKRMLESDYHTDLEKYNKILNFRISDGSTYGMIIEEIILCLNREYSNLGIKSKGTSTSVAGKFKTYEEIENDVKKYVPEFNIGLTVKETIIKIIN